MTTARTIRTRFTRPALRGALALAAGAGILLTPAVAQAAPASAATAVTAQSAAAQTAVNTAMAQLGDPYAWAGAGPNSFDCSGLTQFAWKAAGVALPHSAAAQAGLGTPVSRANLLPGDLVFFYGTGHVGIYIGNNQVVHAPTAGDVVKVTNVDAFHGYSSARRVG
jgi:cell wall-associated NlpC family hydrolase